MRLYQSRSKQLDDPLYSPFPDISQQQFVPLITMLFQTFVLIPVLFASAFSLLQDGGHHLPDCSGVSILELDRFIGKRLDELILLDCFVVSDTIIEGEEGSTWRGKSFKREGQTACLFESNWENRDVVHRITIETPHIKEGSLYVGQQFHEVRHMVSQTIPTSPDGYLFLRLKESNRVVLQIDVSEFDEHSSIYFGVTSLDSIPQHLTIERIIIQ